MTEANYIARVEDVAARRIGEELMIMSGKDSSLFSLNETAALLWQAADGVTPLAQIVEQQICTAYEVDSETALADARATATELAALGILRLSDQPLAAPR